jgi:hypothetical protein
LTGLDTVGLVVASQLALAGTAGLVAISATISVMPCPDTHVVT